MHKCILHSLDKVFADNSSVGLRKRDAKLYTNLICNIVKMTKDVLFLPCQLVLWHSRQVLFFKLLDDNHISSSNHTIEVAVKVYVANLSFFCICKIFFDTFKYVYHF